MNNKKNNYKGFVRSTSNQHSTTNAYQISLPPHVWKRMGWKLNEEIRIDVDKKRGNISLYKEDQAKQLFNKYQKEIGEEGWNGEL